MKVKIACSSLKESLEYVNLCNTFPQKIKSRSYQKYLAKCLNNFTHSTKNMKTKPQISTNILYLSTPANNILTSENECQ